MSDSQTYTLVSSGATDTVFSADQSKLFVAMGDGTVHVFDVATHALLTTWDVGTSLGAISLSKDGSTLLAVEDSPGANVGTLYEINTDTGAVETFSTAGSAFNDVQVVDQSTAILSGGSGGIVQFDMQSGTFTPISGGVYYSNDQVLVGDGHLTLAAEPGISNGPLFIYDDRVHAFTASGDDYETIGAGSGATGFNWGTQAISETAGLVLQFIYSSTINIYDLSLNFIGSVDVGQTIDGLAFDKTGQYVYVHLDSGAVEKFTVDNWQMIESYPVDAINWDNTIGYGNQVLVDDTDNHIVVTNYGDAGGSVQLIDATGTNDKLVGTAGADELAAGRGDDTYVINNVGDQILENPDAGTDRALSSVYFTLPDNVENLTLTGTGNLIGKGNALANDIIGNSGNNYLYGYAGNDTLDGRGGADKLYGGTGDDTFIVDNAGDTVIEYAGEGTDTVKASVSYALRANVENLTLTGSDAIDGTGNALANVMTGNGAANTLLGGAGDDTLRGGLGIDVLDGQEGSDIYIIASASEHSAAEIADTGTTGVDEVLFAAKTAATLTLFAGDTGIEQVAAGAAGSTLELNVDASQVGNALTMIGDAGANILTGTAFDDHLQGGAGADRLIGNAGNDVIDGGHDADKMYGGAGDDTYIVDNASDYYFENAGEGTDTVQSSVSLILRANVENLVLTGASSLNGTGNTLDNVITGNSGNNILSGGDGNDTLDAGAGVDTLHGGNGDDLLIGGAGRDILYGNAGSDTFQFRDGDFGGASRAWADYIVDFSQADGDRIDLHLVDAQTATDGTQAFDFIGTTAFDGHAGELRYDVFGTQTYVSGDTNGDGIADFMIHLNGAVALTSGDFIL